MSTATTESRRYGVASAKKPPGENARDRALEAERKAARFAMFAQLALVALNAASGLALLVGEAAPAIKLHVGGSSLLSLVATFSLHVWLYTACVTARDHLGKGFPFSPGWSIASFFIPIVQLFQPYRVVRALYRASDPHDLPVPTEMIFESNPGYRESAMRIVEKRVELPPVPLALWWAAWLVFNIGPIALVFSGFFSTVLLRLGAVAVGVLTVLIIRGIDAWQTERDRRLDAMEREAERAA